MNKYNLDKLVKVECNDFYPSNWVTYKNEKKIFGFIVQKRGFYDTLFHDYLGTEIPKNHTLKDGVVYENPEVVLHYEAKHSKAYFFNTYNEAKKFADEITAQGRWQS